MSWDIVACIALPLERELSRVTATEPNPLPPRLQMLLPFHCLVYDGAVEAKFDSCVAATLGMLPKGDRLLI